MERKIGRKIFTRSIAAATAFALLFGAGRGLAAPISTPSPTAASGSATLAWLDRVNHCRDAVGLSAIHEDPATTADVAAHVHYLLANFADQISAGALFGTSAFEETPSHRGFTPAGAKIAPNSWVAWGCGDIDTVEIVNRWVVGPFHRVSVLDPAMNQAGYSEGDDVGCWVAAMHLQPPHDRVGPYPHPVEFPPDGANVRLSWIDGESPDPLTSCAGYSAPAGLPISIQLGRLVRTNVSAAILTEDGKTVENCFFDARSYINPNSSAQEYGRWALHNSGAIVMIPRAPLKPGSHYAVSITDGGKTYAWSFTAIAP